MPESKLVAELTGHAATFGVCMALLVYVYNETTFRQFPSLHIIMSGLVILTIFTIDVALTLYFREAGVITDPHKDVKVSGQVPYYFGNFWGTPFLCHYSKYQSSSLLNSAPLLF